MIFIPPLLAPTATLKLLKNVCLKTDLKLLTNLRNMGKEDLEAEEGLTNCLRGVGKPLVR